MDLFPVFLNLRQRPCLVVGGGEVAARKVALLRRSQAQVTVVAPQLCPRLRDAARGGDIRYQEKLFEAADLVGQTLVIAATDDSEVNRSVAKLAKRSNIPVNVVDQPQLGSFTVPSIVDRSPVLVGPLY
jgi:uroporphyrin-III C-methyltransferase/precorrin-2 dehydrogenase/sirohydrochlorin ferrochelatase